VADGGKLFGDHDSEHEHLNIGASLFVRSCPMRTKATLGLTLPKRLMSMVAVEIPPFAAGEVPK
jgi:hypothetical protein